MTTAPATQPQDAMDAAMNPTPVSLERTYFGQIVTVDVWFCVLEKGVGKRPFDPGRDPVSHRRTAIKLQVEVAKKDGGTYTVDQEAIDTSDEWLKHTLPSLRELQLDLRTLRGRWVQIKRVPTGATYPDKKTGELKDRTAIVFVASYPTREAMQAAADEFYKPAKGNGNGAASPAPPQPAAASPSTPTPHPATMNFAERQFAENSLPLLWKSAGEDRARFLQMIADNPLLSKYLKPDSPEVCKFTGDTPTADAF